MDQVIEGNKLIAEFMQFDIEGNTQWYDDEDWGGLVPRKLERSGTVEDLLYHSSWDWLMPVWRKLYLKISDMPPTLYYDDRLKEQVNALRYWYEEMEQPLTKVLIDIAWKTLVKAILWYDTTKPQPNAK